MNTLGAEGDVEVLTVGDRGGGCIAGRAMVSFNGNRVGGNFLPERLARLSVEAHDDELMEVGRHFRRSAPATTAPAATTATATTPTFSAARGIVAGRRCFSRGRCGSFLGDESGTSAPFGLGG